MLRSRHVHGVFESNSFGALETSVSIYLQARELDKAFSSHIQRKRLEKSQETLLKKLKPKYLVKCFFSLKKNFIF